MDQIEIEKLATQLADKVAEVLIRKSEFSGQSFKSEPGKEYLTRAEVCRRHGITLATLAKIQKTGKIPSYRFGDRRVLFRVSEVERYIQDQRFA